MFANILCQKERKTQKNTLLENIIIYECQFAIRNIDEQYKITSKIESTLIN